MRRFTLICVMIVVSMGCRGAGDKRSARTAPAPATPQQVQAIRQMYQLQQPHVVVGVVTAIRPPDRLVAVGDVATLEMRDGQIVQFIDTQQQVLTGGVVVRVLADSVHVYYDPPLWGGREPRVGDIMLRY